MGYLKGVLSISGYPGLYKLISQARKGIIVESLETKKRMPAYASSKISALEDISIFTDDEDVKLQTVIKNIYEKENGATSINHKSKPEEIKAYFAEVLPDFDRDRVYVSDIKRVINWYNILQKLELIDINESEDDEEENEKSEIENNVENKENENSEEKDVAQNTEKQPEAENEK